MKRFGILLFAIALLIVFVMTIATAGEVKKEATKEQTSTKSAKSIKKWQDTFLVDKKDMGPTGINNYFPLKPGFQQIYKEGSITLIRTFLTETKIIDGVETRVVEDKEDNNGILVEIARDYYAIDTITHNVYYFGEDVDNYKDGKMVNHEGSWLSGVKGAKFGLQMPGKIRLGDKFYQERAPEIAMDRAEIVGTNEKVETPVPILVDSRNQTMSNFGTRTFTKCVKVEETSGLEKGAKDYKWYAPGVGMLKDNDMVLIKSSRQ